MPLDAMSAYDYEFYSPEQRDPSQWAASTSTSMPMAREPSGESMSSEPVQTPISEYDMYEAPWPFISPGSHDSFYGPAWDPNHDYPLPPHSYNPFGASGEWRAGEHFDFAMMEPSQQDYWRFKPGFEPRGQLPVTGMTEDVATIASYSQTQEGGFVCGEPGCAKVFKRKSDRDRHSGQIHTPSDRKAKLPCDWKKCPRAQDPFHRLDHQRDHYRSYHHEDLTRRSSSGGEDRDWWRSRRVSLSWWRCSHCLRRVRFDDSEYTCPKCRTDCEPARQRYREDLRILQLGPSSSSSTSLS